MVDDLDTWLSALDASVVRKRLKEKEARANELAHEHRRIEDELVTVREEIEKARAALALKDRFTVTRLPNVSAAGVAGGIVDSLAAERPAPGRESIRAVVSAMPEIRLWTPRLMLKELKKRGWTDADEAHAVQVSMSRMAANDEFVRPRKGVYVPRAAFDAATIRLRFPTSEGDDSG